MSTNLGLLRTEAGSWLCEKLTNCSRNCSCLRAFPWDLLLYLLVSILLDFFLFDWNDDLQWLGYVPFCRVNFILVLFSFSYGKCSARSRFVWSCCSCHTWLWKRISAIYTSIFLPLIAYVKLAYIWERKWTFRISCSDHVLYKLLFWFE